MVRPRTGIHLEVSILDMKRLKKIDNRINLIAVESRVFSLGRRNAFFNLFSPQLREINQVSEVNAISKQVWETAFVVFGPSSIDISISYS
jgi:hypothetical protein